MPLLAENNLDKIRTLLTFDRMIQEIRPIAISLCNRCSNSNTQTPSLHESIPPDSFRVFQQFPSSFYMDSTYAPPIWHKAMLVPQCLPRRGADAIVPGATHRDPGRHNREVNPFVTRANSVAHF